MSYLFKTFIKFSRFNMTREKSEVWKYFKKLIGTNESLCILCEKNPCKNCAKEGPCKLQGMLPGNAKRHLKFYHPNEHEQVEKIDGNKEAPAAKKPRVEQKESPSTSTAQATDEGLL